MKTRIFFVLWVCALSAYAQLNHFLPHTTDTYFSIANYKIWFRGDTLINAKKYKKAYRNFGETVNFNAGRYYAAVREDTLGGKIYGIHPADGQERLLCDFSLQPNDETTVYCYWPFFNTPQGIAVKVKSVGIRLIAGKERRVLTLESKNYPAEDSWIEGFGSASGLFTPVSSGVGVADLGDPPQLLCVHASGEKIYRHPYIDVCFKDEFPDSKADIHVVPLTIYPTAVIDKLSVIFRGTLPDTPFSYTITNTQGIVMLKGVVDTSVSPIDVSLLKKGLYFIALSHNDNQHRVATYKFIKL